MLAADAYRPDEWHDFFIMVGGAAAVLMGLVFAIMTAPFAEIYRALAPVEDTKVF